MQRVHSEAPSRTGRRRQTDLVPVTQGAGHRPGLQVASVHLSTVFRGAMNKSELTQTLSEKCGISPEEAVTIVDTFFDSIKDNLLSGDRVELRGFGSFQMKEYKGYRGRNPKTGESVQVEPKTMPFFKAGKGLKEFLNE